MNSNEVLYKIEKDTSATMNLKMEMTLLNLEKQSQPTGLFNMERNHLQERKVDSNLNLTM